MVSCFGGFLAWCNIGSGVSGCGLVTWRVLYVVFGLFVSVVNSVG